jgi:hypothetical protein
MMLGIQNIPNMMIDMKPIVERCDRQLIYNTPAGLKFICQPCPKPDNIPIEELLKNSKYFIARDITLEDCQTCHYHGGVPVSAPKPKKYPSLTRQAENYAIALAKWTAAKFPVRTNEEIKFIFSQHCAKCDWFDLKKKRCKNCGCRVTTSSIAIVNKIKMATEHCPRGLW